MRDITEEQRKLEALYSDKFCHVKSIADCPNKEQCGCKIAAEIRAYINTVIPEGYQNFSITDFTGIDKQGCSIVQTDTITKAREQLSSFCWDNLKREDIGGMHALDIQQMDARSLMDRRKKEGANLVIYADSETVGHQKGKTIVASLVMKEAIKRRAAPGNNSDTYDWIEFRLLMDHLRSGETNNVAIGLSETRYCDWLVVDNIPSQSGSSIKAKTYVASLLDPFFLDRLNEKLSTIFVFRFDVDHPNMNIERNFGIAIDRILQDSRTSFVSLCGEKETDGVE